MTILKKISVDVGFTTTIFFASASFAFAACTTPTAGTLPNPLNVCSIQDLIFLIAQIATYIGVIAAVIALIWVGFKFIAAQGKPEELTKARSMFFWIIIGIAVLIGASAIVTILKNTLTAAGVVQAGVL